MPIKRRILFVSDLGFQYGAGIAQARQIQSFMQLGWEVGALAWEPGDVEFGQTITQPVNPDQWLGMRRLRHHEPVPSRDDVIMTVTLEVARFDPEVVVVGNLHAAGWPLEILTALRALGCRVIVFLHDLHYITGRCAYPGACQMFLTGCDESCPTAEQYPPLARDLISGQWHLRRQLFNGADGIEVVTNSDWTTNLFQAAVPQGRSCATVHLGADDTIFCPGNKEEARRSLDLPTGKPLILCAAVNFEDSRKGGHALLQIIEALKNEVVFIAFGHNTEKIPGLIGLGYTTDARKLARFYQAADIYLGIATEEAFGQTLMEAQLCGRPVVVFQAGGVVEIVRNEITGKLVPVNDAASAVSAIRSLLHDAHMLHHAGVWARESAARRFSLAAQARSWQLYLTGSSPSALKQKPPTLIHPYTKGAALPHRPSWPCPGTFISEAHENIFSATSKLPGWQMPGDSWKLYEMGYFAGEVILEIGTFGGRSATVELRGALANSSRTRPPQFFGVDIAAEAIARTRQTLADNGLIDYCHLFEGTLSQFVRGWQIEPTMVFLDGDHRYEGARADMKVLATYLRSGIPVLVHDYLNPENETGTIGVRQATDEWIATGEVRFLGCFGCAALVVIV